jgi:uncharacterized protein YdeI (YjbR/CyaY-like superfamily)
MAAESRRPARKLTLELPAGFVERLADAAELSRRSVEQFVEDVLAAELDRYDAAFPLPVPAEDVQRALDANPAAAEFFATVSRANHAAILHRIDEAKRPATRARRIEQAITMLLEGRTPYRD